MECPLQALDNADSSDSITYNQLAERLSNIPDPFPSKGIQNKLSNCWLSSILQCLFASPFRRLIFDIADINVQSSRLVNALVFTFKQMAGVSTSSSGVSVRFMEGPLAIAESVEMTLSLAEHQDGSEFFNQILNRLCPENEQGIKLLFQLTNHWSK